MNKKLLYLRLGSAILAIAIPVFCILETRHILATPTQDDIFGHSVEIFMIRIGSILMYVVLWEFYKGWHYFISDGPRTMEKTVSNTIASRLSTVILAVSAGICLFFRREIIIWIAFVAVVVEILIGNRLITGICIERNTPWDESRWINFVRAVKNAARYIMVVLLGIICFMNLMLLLSAIC